MRPLFFLRPGRLVKLGSVTASASVAYYVLKKHAEDTKNPAVGGGSDGGTTTGAAALTADYIPPPFYWETIPGFIKKKFEPPYPANSSAWNFMSSLVMGGVGSFGKFFIYCLNDTHTHNMQPTLDIIDQENRARGLITVSNHASVWDDPFLWGVLPTKTLFSVDKMRWVLGAADICYTSLFKSLFFSLGQGIPTIRGAGVYQPAIDFAIHKMDQHQWIHIFPEARVNQGDDLIRFKWGIGRIVMEAKECPIIIPGPFVQLFNPITVVFGEPIDVQDVLNEWQQGKLSEEEARIRITSIVYEALKKLKEDAENNRLKN
ncbi:hypothetical protein PHYBLDRAFT_183702 [Phycomyces blakesleeanus NRRL 1555(-)]|uniref:Tafazzin family protein n=1 Tax=Phycomyces blakesleeanus (strain ATCC 8743b / DSM 1359 / FGSC 10004 / NBRC 33097 / NRRL 1555) TaxID=763407 RepID=A0A162ZI40_PHYB8|nr:hypothetical protein PHYBLDRAFT_183702 [Phycomyces blakesleeanus NRRL 1555(-)]OAD66921.1 hypothetical protein PHYBLDRAFT_183702 [Phycomyces blakesleeanus NRRL 1555(-)]|eukprot:XP_018284961.1 hypothetical protein PHYBLDRAFT_183702 [Phycomyces blakesleeanus NRRL 1555(-)]